MAKTVCFGEIMLRLSPPGFERLFQSPQLQATFGGGEANVAVSLAQFGHDSHYVTRLPKNPIGDAALKVLRAEGVGVDARLRGGERLGIYFAETGASQRASTVVYDRAHSAISRVDAGHRCRGRSVLTGANWFHCTGITPALGRLGGGCTPRSDRGGARPRRAVSVDLNFRSQAVDRGRGAARDAAAHAVVDVVVANEEDLQAVLGIEVAHADVTGGVLDVGRVSGCRRARVARNLGHSSVAVTLRESLSASDNGWSAVLYDAAI